jgi:type II secretory pathway component GspD/PulD (secretin)
LSACGTSVASSATPEFVGALALAVEPPVAKELALSDEQHTKLLAVIDTRENEAVELAVTLKDLSPAERDAKLAAFRRESEAKGLAILTPEQRAKLEKLRLARTGLAALAEPPIAEQLRLSEDQQKEVAAVLKERAEKLAAADVKTGPLVRAETERKLAGLLNKPQRTEWEAMSGSDLPVVEAAKTAEVEPADTKVADTKPAEPKESDTKPADTKAADTKVADTKTPDAKETPDAMDEALREELEGPDPLEQLAEEWFGPGDKTADKKLRFKFRYAPWKEVLDWFATQAGLSLVAEKVPSGTFNYTDETREYTTGQALDVLNSVLLTKGFTLVRRDDTKAVTLVDLADAIPGSLVQEVLPEQLELRGDFELVSVIFKLDRLTPEEAEAEIKKLIGAQGSIITLPKSRQIKVTETAGKLRTIRAVLARIEDPLGTGGEFKIFPVKHITPAEAFDMMRPFLDIPEGKNAPVDNSVRIVVDAPNKRLLASGKAERLAKIQEILEKIDPEGLDAVEPGKVEEPQLEVYSIRTADPDAVLAVLQTLFSGVPNVRLAKDAKTGNIIAMATPAQHATIRATIDQLEKDQKVPEVIKLRVVDPQLAVLAINKLFGGGDPAKGPVNPNAPQVDAEPTARQLLIRGTLSQIAQIRSLLEKMGETAPGTDTGPAVGANVRVLPLKGRSTAAVLEDIQKIWPAYRPNPIRVVTPSASGIPQLRISGAPESAPEDVVDPGTGDRTGGESPAVTPKKEPPAKPTVKPSALETPRDKSAAVPARQGTPFMLVAETKAAPAEEMEEEPAAEEPAAEGLANGKTAVKKPAPRKDPATIVIMPGPNGLMVASEDVEALNQFEQLLNQITGGTGGPSGPEMTIFYLKHAKANIVAETLDQIFGGGTLAGGASGGGSGGGGLLGGLAGAALGGGGGGGILGSLLGLGGEDSGIAPSGSIKINYDMRLNALIVQANATDVATIEQLLKILDLPQSPEEVLIQPKAKMIALKNTQAEEVAMILRETYQDRMVAGPNQPGRTPSPQEFMQMLRGGGGRRGGGGAGGQRGGQEEVQKMTVSIDTRTNSIVLAAPEPLFTEVAKLIEDIDAAALKSNQTLEIVTLRGAAGADTVQMALGALVGDQVQFSRAMGGRSMMRSTVNRRQPGMGMQQAGGFRQPGMTQPGMMQPGMAGGMQPGVMGMPTGGMTGGMTGRGGFQPTGGFQPGGTMQPGGVMPMMTPGMGGTGRGMGNGGMGMGTGGGRTGGGRTGGGRTGGGRTGGGRTGGGGQF